MNKIYLIPLLACLTFAAPVGAQEKSGRAPAQYSPSELEKLWRPVGHKRRKQVTSNAFHFWAWSRNEAEALIGPYLNFTGVVIGDPHPRNVFDYRSGRKKAALAVADIDDGGRGPLFLDFARYVTYLEAAKLDMKIGKVFNEYVSGLRGQPVDRSEVFEEAQEESLADIEKAHLKYLRKNTIEGKFRYEDLRMTRIPDLLRAKREEADALGRVVLEMTGLRKIYDVGYRVNDSGSSAGLSRYWYLLGSDTEPTRIVEAKELADRPALDYYQSQSGDEARVREVVNAYSSEGLDPKLFGVVRANKANYWVRPRKFQYLKLDDEDLDDD